MSGTLPRCTWCYNYATQMCGRCFEPYCSEVCQIHDWRKHKSNCIPMPGLISMNYMFNLISKLDEKQANYSTMHANKEEEEEGVTRLPIDFVQSSSMPEAECFDESYNLDKNWKCFKTKQLTFQEEDLTDVVARTAGLSMDSNELKSISHKMDCNKIAKANQLSTSPQLVGNKTVETRENRSYATNTCLSKFDSIPTDEIFLDEMRTHEEFLENQAIPKLKMNEPAKCSDKLITKVYTFDEDIKLIQLEEGDNIKLLITDTSCLGDYIVGAMDFEKASDFKMADKYKRLSEYCAMSAKTKRGYTPKLNEVCLVIYDEDGEWYRAFSLSEKPMDNGKILVNFFDFGNQAVVPLENIMPVTKEFLYPTLVNFCRIINFETSDIPKFKRYIRKKSVIRCSIALDEKNMHTYNIAIKDLDEILNKR